VVFESKSLRTMNSFFQSCSQSSMTIAYIIQYRKAKLSYDVLNPARVTLYWLNKSTLRTDFSSRMRWADIEVANNHFDMISRWLLRCYPQGNFFVKFRQFFKLNLKVIKQTFIPIRSVNLIVKHSSGFTLFIHFWDELRMPLRSSITF